jgi:esterase/lipase superfamily enzyme
MTILVSPDDLALSVSSTLSSSRLRLGQLDVKDPEVAAAARKAHVQLIDISSLKTNDSLKHNRFAALAALYPKLKMLNDRAPGSRVRQAGVFVLDAMTATIEAPLVITQKAIAGQ